jgi:hypothetical protein
MSANDPKSGRRIPPPPVLVAIAALVIVVPVGSWTLVGLREWRHGGSPAAELEAPYFWGVLLFRLAGAFLLASLLCFRRTSASIWITVTSVWLAGPPLQMLLTGIELLSASSGQQSLPTAPLGILMFWSVGPAMITVCLLAFRSSREAYGLMSRGST